MKKFTISFLTVFFFCVSVFSGAGDYAIITGVAAAVSEISSTEEKFDAQICYDSDDWGQTSLLMPNDFEYLYNEDTFSYYDQLDNNNKSAYNAMKVWLNPTTENISIPLPESINFQADSATISNWSEEQQNEFWNLVMANIKEGKIALTFDYPELFWLDEKKIMVSVANATTSRNFLTRKYNITVSEIVVSGNVKDVYTDIETAKGFQSMFENGVNNFDVKGTDNYSKIKYIHDSIIEKVNYDLSAPYCDTALGFFIEPYGIICEGYAKAMKILCDKENIPCILVVGNINLETNFAHMWNYIQMEDGKWYAVDCTWDDLDNETNPIKYQYFLKGSDSFNSNHTPDNTYITPAFTYPELSETDYVYSSVQPLVTTSVTPQVTTAETTTVSISTESLVTSSITGTSESTVTVMTVNSSTVSPVAFTTTSVSTTNIITGSVLKGDFNNNGKLDTGDAVVLQRKLVKSLEISDNDLNYELYDDKRLNIWDYVILLRRIRSI